MRRSSLIGEQTESSAENFLIYLDQRPRVTWIVTKRNSYPTADRTSEPVSFPIGTSALRSMTCAPEGIRS